MSDWKDDIFDKVEITLTARQALDSIKQCVSDGSDIELDDKQAIQFCTIFTIVAMRFDDAQRGLNAAEQLCNDEIK